MFKSLYACIKELLTFFMLGSAGPMCAVYVIFRKCADNGLILEEKVLEVLEIQVLEIHLYYKYPIFQNISSTLYLKYLYIKIYRYIKYPCT